AAGGVSTLSLHDALPILADQMVRESSAAFAERLRARFPDAEVSVALPRGEVGVVVRGDWQPVCAVLRDEFGFESLVDLAGIDYRSEEHTSELQSRENLVC